MSLGPQLKFIAFTSLPHISHLFHRTLHNWWWAQESTWFWRAVHRGIFQRKGWSIQLVQWWEDTSDFRKVCSLGTCLLGMFYTMACLINWLCLQDHKENRDPSPPSFCLFLLYKKSLSLWENRTLSEMSVDQNPRLVSPRFLQQTVEVAFLDTEDCWVQDRARVVGLDWKLKSSDLDTNQERPSPIQGSHQVCVSCRSLSIFSKGQDAPSAWLMWVLSTFWINNIKRLVS